MDIREYLKSIGIDKNGTFGENNSYVIQLNDSNEFGRIFTKLDNSDDLEQLEENQVITLQGSSLMYESLSEPLLFNLIADFDGDVYQLIVNILDN